MTFFYLDPPYLQTEDYRHVRVVFNRHHHDLLASKLAAVQGRWLLSYNDHPQVVQAYSRPNVTIEKIDRANNMGKNRVYHELLIRNY